MKFLALCATAVAAVKLTGEENFLQMKATTRRTAYPRDQGMSRPWDKSLEDDDGELDIRAVEDMSDEVDPNHYRGEDERREQINEQVTHWKQERNHPVIVRSQTNHRYRTDDMW